MKKVFIIGLILVLLFSGLGPNAISKEDDKEYEKVSIAFSKPVIIDEKENVIIDIDEANSLLMKTNKPLLPSYVHSFVFPFGTKIHNIEVIPKITKEIELTKKITKTPVSFTVDFDLKTDIEKSIFEPYPDKIFNYEIRTGIVENIRCVICNVEVLPIVYYQNQQKIEWINEVDIIVEYEKTNHLMTFQDEFQYIILTSDDFYNAIEAVRFEYLLNKAFVSVGFADSSDTTFIKITDNSGQNIPIIFTNFNLTFAYCLTKL